MACRRVWVILLAHSYTYKVFKLLRFANTSSGMTDILLLDISLFKRIKYSVVPEVSVSCH